tara:strand:- start:622 stop:729 length:108 start_codon:yes stop_codon:yes gene_type:complete
MGRIALIEYADVNKSCLDNPNKNTLVLVKKLTTAE